VLVSEVQIETYIGNRVLSFSHRYNGVHLPFTHLNTVGMAGIVPGVMQPNLADPAAAEVINPGQHSTPRFLFLHTAEQQALDVVEND
jgi:hypothetical protein